jgi:hypothetical protein
MHGLQFRACQRCLKHEKSFDTVSSHLHVQILPCFPIKPCHSGHIISESYQPYSCSCTTRLLSATTKTEARRAETSSSLRKNAELSREVRMSGTMPVRTRGRIAFRCLHSFCPFHEFHVGLLVFLSTECVVVNFLLLRVDANLLRLNFKCLNLYCWPDRRVDSSRSQANGIHIFILLNFR